MTGPFAGVDGCRAGWIAVLHQPTAITAIVVPDFASLVAQLSSDATIAVDMPIGLPDRIGPGGRGPEALVRPLLGARQSSVFSIPSRSAVYATDYREACHRALATSDPPRKVSRQSFHLFDKMREIDRLMIDRPELRNRVFEAHPEVAFWRLNGERAMTLPKKVRGSVNPAGLAERRTLLEGHGYEPAFLLTRPAAGVGADDLLDAAVLALIARRHQQGVARSFPAEINRDTYGIPVAIWA